jgi:hypothetical protein
MGEAAWVDVTETADAAITIAATATDLCRGIPLRILIKALLPGAFMEIGGLDVTMTCTDVL